MSGTMYTYICYMYIKGIDEHNTCICGVKLVNEHTIILGLRPAYTAKVSGIPIQSNWLICSRNKRSKKVSGTCVQCMQAFR